MSLLTKIRATGLLCAVVMLGGCVLPDSAGSSSGQSRSGAAAGIEMPELPPGTKDGELIERYPNGNIHYKAYVKNGCLDRAVEIYYENNNKLKMSVPMRSCEINGLVKMWHPNGRLDQEVTITNGILNGPLNSYYDTPANRVHIKANLLNGKQDGILEEYSESGKLLKRVNVSNGKVTQLK